MEILEYAMNLEKEGEDYYRTLAENCPNDGVKKILIWLADEEVKHFNIFREMHTGAPKIQVSDIIERSKNVFTEMKISKSFEAISPTQTAAYRKALDLERKTYDFYMKQFEESEDPEHKKIFLTVANEEDKHYKLVYSIIDFITAPERYIDNAEFYHIGPY
jgi:rubrerythrin